MGKEENEKSIYCQKINEIECPYVGWSGGSDDYKLGLEPMTCQKELKEYEAAHIH
ncbi:MAG: hypothetical protein O8C66_08855 [Candidatus Methanoperedens sp.]|nr:hypothetical protein [Candidatus Methanoperedens sp.]MCZ7370605.1 hypothetical protein [Candidatus Methanoperedens sp.]